MSKPREINFQIDKAYIPTGPSVELKFSEALQSSQTRQTPPAGIHHSHPALDIRPIF